jgi:hypothetical protein
MLMSDTRSYADAFGALEAAGAALRRTLNPTILFPECRGRPETGPNLTT